MRLHRFRLCTVSMLETKRYQITSELMLPLLCLVPQIVVGLSFEKDLKMEETTCLSLQEPAEMDLMR